MRLTPDDQYQGQAPILKVAGPYVHVAWVDYRYGFFFCGDVFYSKSDDSGKTWSQALPLSDSHRVYPVTPALEIDLPVADALELPQGAEARPCTSPELPLTLTVRDPDEQTLWQHHGCATEEQFDETLESLTDDDETSFRCWPQSYTDKCAQGSDYYCCIIGGGGWGCVVWF